MSEPTAPRTGRDYESLDQRLQRLTREAPAQAPEGWYPDPEDQQMERFWDGSVWSSKRREKASEFTAPENFEAPDDVRPVTSEELGIGASEAEAEAAPEPGSKKLFRDPAERIVRTGNPYAIVAIAFSTASLALAVLPITYFATFSIASCAALAAVSIVTGVVGLIEAQNNAFAGLKSVALIGAVIGLFVLMWVAVVVLGLGSQLDADLDPEAAAVALRI